MKKSTKKQTKVIFWVIFSLIVSGCIYRPGMNYLNQEPYPVLEPIVDAYSDKYVNIGLIQGEGHLSPYTGKLITDVTGVVTAVRDNGFYIQSITPDENFHTSDAILVHIRKPIDETVRRGDYVLVSGIVEEFIPGGAQSGNLSTTQVVVEEITIYSSNNKLPEPIIIGINGLVPPDTIIDDDQMNEFNLFDGIDFYESLEGMLVRIEDAVVVSPKNQYGEIVVLGDFGKFASGLNIRGGITINKEDFNPERLILDDVFVLTPDVKVGDQFINPIIGIMDYSFGNYKILPIEKMVPISNKLERQTYSRKSDSEITIATYNVENLSPLDEIGRFEQLAIDITNHLDLPDIIALQEIQDNNGFIDDDIVSADLTFRILIDEIQKLSNVHYRYIEISPINDMDGGMAGANIRVGYLFRTDRNLKFINENPKNNFFEAEINKLSNEISLIPNPSLVGINNFAFNQSRKPLVAEFLFNEQKIFIINNHWTSKSSDNSLFGRNQPPIYYSESQRMDQSKAVKDFLLEILRIGKESHIIVLGDMNDYYFSNSILNLEEGTGLVNLINKLPKNERYNYIFEGNSQNLDNILISKLLLNSFLDINIVHINSEYPINLRLSDHDPIIVTFDGKTLGSK
ncbi:MAG: hypothetical protein Q7U53_06640 [Anaerolineaceae bacterium]|nr:hypothetical protein [Anaerolineaceae bacterium]